MALDNLNIVYKMNEEKTEITILKVLWADNSSPREKLRTREWLLKISELMDFSKTSDSPSEIKKQEI